MARFIDSHVHLADPAFDDDREGVIERARITGASALVCIGESLGSAERSARIAAAHPGFVYFTAGVHPHDAAGFDPIADPDRIREFIAQGAVAVGECGLDYHYDHSPRELQRRAFASQLAIAADTGRPVVVHTREAVDDTAAMVREAGKAGITGVLHCFGGPRRSERSRSTPGGTSPSAASSPSRSGTTTRCCASRMTTGFSSRRTRRISPPCRIVASATSLRLPRLRLPAWRRRAA